MLGTFVSAPYLGATMSDVAKALQKAHDQGQKDGSNGEYHKPYDSDWELSNMVSLGLRFTLEGVSSEEREEIDKAYDAGWNNANNQKWLT